MSGSWTVRRSRRLLAALVLSLAAVLAALPGSALAQDENTAPVISNVNVQPSGLSHEGGLVTITADVTDADNDIVDVYVAIAGPTSEATSLFNLGGSTYEGSFIAPPNFTHEPVSYQFTVYASDSAFNEAQAYGGEVQVDGEPQFDELPAVFDPSISPMTVSSAGGPVTLAVSATDSPPGGITEVTATVCCGTAGPATVITLEPISSTRFEGTFDVPLHTGSPATTYAVEFTATDSGGQQSSVNAGHILQLGAPVPPAAPLRLSTSLLDFGDVQIGKQARRKVVLRNTGAAGTAPVTGAILAPGPGPFSLGGDKASIPFDLSAGQTKTFMVRFRPKVAADRRARIRVQRTDGAQSGLGLTAIGTGV